MVAKVAGSRQQAEVSRQDYGSIFLVNRSKAVQALCIVICIPRSMKRSNKRANDDSDVRRHTGLKLLAN